MTSILKNQLVKHLSKFTKNLKPEQISLDVLKGNSKLQFVEIDEAVLSDILELPKWLKIKKAYCVGVAVNVPWTKLKTCPIQIFIDEIAVDVELVTGSDSSTTPKNSFGLTDSTSYGFINKTIENMSLYINTVEINFDSELFGGSFMLQRLSLENRSPGWAQVKDLRQTRITCSTSNISLVYKQLSWHLLRIEASAKSSKDEQRSKINAPLRLITSGGKIRIALKKKCIDGCVVNARIQTILDDILWVATLPQLCSAISFSSHILKIMQNCQQNEKNQGSTHPNQENLLLKKLNEEKTNDFKGTSSSFSVFNFEQTSYHLYVKKIDLHLCDDPNSGSNYPPGWDIESGAMQVTLIQVLIDVYPEADALSDRATWVRYQCTNSIAAWTKAHLINQFEHFVSKEKDATMKTRIERCWPQLIGNFLVIRIHDVIVQCVSDLCTKKDALKNLFQSERSSQILPNDQHVVHIEVGSFCHPHTNSLPVPNSFAYCQVGPFTYLHDQRTTRWCFYVASILQSTIENEIISTEENTPALKTPVLKLQLIMPRVLIDLPLLNKCLRSPSRVVINMSTLSVVSLNNLDIWNNTCFRFLATMPETETLKETHKRFLSPGNTAFDITTSPIWVETDQGVHTKGVPFINDVSFVGRVVIDNQKTLILIEPVDPISVVLDHFQYIQLISLGERLNTFSDLIKSDLNHYAKQKSVLEEIINFVVDVSKININVVLAKGILVSPYDEKTTTMDNSRAKEETGDSTSRSFQSLHPKNQSNICAVKENPEKLIEKNMFFEEFPEFPKTSIYNDPSPMLDETLSISTSIGDDGALECDEVPNDDPFAPPELAVEATTIDTYVNSEYYQAAMSEQNNLLAISLQNSLLSGYFSNGYLKVHGSVERVQLDQQLCIYRSEVDMLMKTIIFEDFESSNNKNNASFEIHSFPDSKITHISITLQNLEAIIEDEILTHISLFLEREEQEESKVRLSIHVCESNIRVVDRKKKKPMKLKIKSLLIEQEED